MVSQGSRGSRGSVRRQLPNAPLEVSLGLAATLTLLSFYYGFFSFENDCSHI